jgi:hypothetical protein
LKKPWSFVNVVIFLSSCFIRLASGISKV